MLKFPLVYGNITVNHSWKFDPNNLDQHTKGDDAFCLHANKKLTSLSPTMPPIACALFTRFTTYFDGFLGYDGMTLTGRLMVVRFKKI